MDVDCGKLSGGASTKDDIASLYEDDVDRSLMPSGMLMGGETGRGVGERRSTCVSVLMSVSTHSSGDWSRPLCFVAAGEVTRATKSLNFDIIFLLEVCELICESSGWNRWCVQI